MGWWLWILRVPLSNNAFHKGILSESKPPGPKPTINHELTHSIHVWYIYLHLPYTLTINVGKYTSPMDGKGWCNPSPKKTPNPLPRRTPTNPCLPALDRMPSVLHEAEHLWSLHRESVVYFTYNKWSLRRCVKRYIVYESGLDHLSLKKLKCKRRFFCWVQSVSIPLFLSILQLSKNSCCFDPPSDAECAARKRKKWGSVRAWRYIKMHVALHVQAPS